MNPDMPKGPVTALSVASTALSLANAIVVANTQVLMRKGILSKEEAQTLVLEVVELVQHATDRSQAVGIADKLCSDLEAFAASLGQA